jgi:hypothetical protein
VQEIPANWRQKALRKKLLVYQYVTWLGRQDSNLGMAESKSGHFFEQNQQPF